VQDFSPGTTIKTFCMQMPRCTLLCQRMTFVIIYECKNNMIVLQTLVHCYKYDLLNFFSLSSFFPFLPFSSLSTGMWHIFSIIYTVCNLFLKNCKMKTLIDLKTLTLRKQKSFGWFSRKIYFQIKYVTNINEINIMKLFNARLFKIDSADCKTIGGQLIVKKDDTLNWVDLLLSFLFPV
jgi:hypothetical protein